MSTCGMSTRGKEQRLAAAPLPSAGASAPPHPDDVSQVRPVCSTLSAQAMGVRRVLLHELRTMEQTSVYSPILRLMDICLSPTWGHCY